MRTFARSESDSSAQADYNNDDIFETEEDDEEGYLIKKYPNAAIEGGYHPYKIGK